MKRRSGLRAFGVVIVGGLIASGCSLIGGGGGTYRVSAYFPRAVSVYATSEVRVLGLPAGTVNAVVIEGDRVRIDLDIDDDIPLPADVKAVIIPQSLIGERYVQLMPAWTTGQPRAEDGHEIDLEDTIVPVEPDEALAALNEFLEDLDPDGLGRLIDNTATALDGNGAQLNRALDSVSQLVDTFADRDAELVGIVENFDRFNATLVTREQQLGEVLDTFATATQVLADERESIEALVANLADLADAGLDLVSEHAARLRTDIATLDRLVSSVNANLDAVGQLLDSGPLLVTGLANAYNPTLRATNLRNAFSPLAQELLNPVLRDLLGDPDFSVPCIPLPGTICETGGVTGAAGPGGEAVPAALPAGAPAPTPIDDVLGLLGAPTEPLTGAPSPSTSARVADGLAGVGTFFRDAASAMVGVPS